MVAAGAGTTLYLVCVPDDAIEHVADTLAEALADGTSPAARTIGASWPLAVAHTSGATSTAALAACGRAGALTLAVHPLQTFSDPASGPRRLEGTAMAVTPGLPETAGEAWLLGERIAHAVGARPFLLQEEDRVLYHAAATIASNYLVTVAHVAEDLFTQAGFPPGEALPALLPLMRGALDNLAQQGSVAALTGPLSRGDVATVSAHISELADRAPAHLPMYRRLGEATLEIVRLRATVAPATVAALAALLADTPLQTLTKEALP